MRIVFKDTPQLQKILAAVARIAPISNFDFHQNGFDMQCLSDSHLFLGLWKMRPDSMQSLEPPTQPFRVGMSMTVLSNLCSMAKKDEQVAWEVKPAQDVFHIQFGDTRMIVNQMHLEEDQMQVPEDMSDDALLLFKNNALLRDWTTKMAITKASVTIEVTPNIVRWVSRSDAWGTIQQESGFNEDLKLVNIKSQARTTLCTSAFPTIISVVSCGKHFKLGFSAEAPTRACVALTDAGQSTMEIYVAPQIPDEE